MYRFLAVLLVPVVAAALAPAAPVPKLPLKPQGPVYYYPTTVGAKWVYDSNGRDQTHVVSQVEDRKGVKVVVVEEVTPKGQEVNEVMEVSEAGLARLSCGGAAFDNPLHMLQAPFRAGTSWKIKSGEIEGTGTIKAVETIKVPAGTFEAVRVDAEYTLGKQPCTYTAWYAPGVGLLKMTQGDKDIWLLKSFSPGK